MTARYHSFINLDGGMQQGVDATLHRPNEYALAINASVRGGLLQTRPALDDIGIVVPAGLYQGGFLYRHTDATYLVFMIAGVVHLVNLDTQVWTSLGLLLSATSTKAHFCQASRFLIIQDNDFPATWAAKSWPAILDGNALYDQSVLRGTNPEQSTPKGGPMAFGHGRLFVASPYVFDNVTPSANLGMKGWVAGDIIKAYAPEELLSFTENTYLDEGGQITLPDEFGEIKAMAFQRNVANGVGQGSLVVGAEHGFASYSVNSPRDQWNDIDLGQIVFSGIGTRSRRSFVNINSDLFFRSSDGEMRTLTNTAQLEQRGFLSKQSISSEIYDTLKNDTISTLEKCSAITEGARIIATVLPSEQGTFSGVVSLDLLPLSSMAAQVQPAWESVWTGYNVLECLPGLDEDRETGLLVSEDSDGIRRCYKPLLDGQAGSEDSQIESWLMTSAYSGSNPFQFKKFKYAHLWISRILSDATVTIYYRPDRSSLWAKTSESSLLFTGTYHQNRRLLRFTPMEPVPVQRPSNILMTNGFTHQFAIKWTGRLVIERAQFFWEDQTEDYDVAKAEAAPAVEFATATGLYDVDFYSYRRT